MNKFLTFAGVQPVYLGDIDFMQNAASDIFSQLAGALMNQDPSALNAILYGVSITRSESTTSWTAGAVVLNGEILKVPAGSISIQDTLPLYFHVVSVLSGDRVFKDGVSRECYETRTATINGSSTGGVNVNSMQLLHKTIDFDYDAYWKTADVTSAKLLQRNGLFFIDFTAQIEDGQTTFDARMKFEVTSQKDIHFNGTRAMYVALGYDGAIVPMYFGVQCGRLAAGSYEITVIAYNTVNASGSARFTGMLPVY
jgi:hypothetical protein